jgi:hypothetical protein
MYVGVIMHIQNWAIKKNLKQDALVHAYNSNYLEVEIKGLQFKVSWGKEIVRPHVNYKSRVVACTCYHLLS